MTEVMDQRQVIPAAALAPVLPPAPTAPPAMLGYASGLDSVRLGQSRWGVASFVVTAFTVVFCIVCFIGMTQARGWDGLGWLVVGFLGNWVGCGIAALLALIGVVQRRRGRRLASHALWIGLVLGLGPIGICWLVAHF